MLIKKLIDYYDKLYSEGADIPVYGWEKYPVTYMVDLNKDGSINKIVSLLEETVERGKNGKEKKVTRKKNILVPFHPGRSTDFRHYLYCDTADYMFSAGTIFDPKEKQSKKDRVPDKFKCARETCHEILDGATGDAANAILNFFDSWDYKHVADLQIVKDNIEFFSTKAFIIWGYNGVPVTEDAECVAKYDAFIKEHGYSGTNERGTDIITGEQNVLICRVHPAITGIKKCDGKAGPPGGARLCCSNNPSTDYDDKQQGYCFPMSEVTAFKYRSALAYLINDRKNHCIFNSLDNSYILLWSLTSSEQEDTAIKDAISADIRDNDGEIVVQDKENKTSQSDYLNYLRNIFHGYKVDADKPAGVNEPVYTILNLDSRDGCVFRVKWMYEGSLSELAESIIRHYDDTLIAGNNTIMTPFQVTKCSSPKANDGKIVNDPRKPYGSLIQSLIKGTEYPHYLANSLQSITSREILSDGGNAITPERAAAMKAILNQNNKRSIKVNLDETNDSMAYLYGRALCMGEQLQYRALGKRGKPLSAAYLPMMMTRPNQAMACVNVKVEYYLKKIRQDKPALGTALTKKWTQMQSMLDPSEIPHTFTNEDRMILCCGFYQEKQAAFERIQAQKQELEEQKAAAEKAGKDTSEFDAEEKALEVYADEAINVNQ